jgi:hypothetical protein
MFGAGPHDQIKELNMGHVDGGIQAAVHACPEITEMAVSEFRDFMQEDLNIILGTCKSLQQLSIGYFESISFACLESSLCTRSLTSIKINNKLASGSIEVISRCCPAIEELSVCDVGPVDVRAMASLMRLHVLEMMSYGHDQEQGSELAEAFTALDSTEGATLFARLVLMRIKFDVTRLLSTRRCSALRELELFECDGITEQAMQALAINVRDSLVVLMVSLMPVALIDPLLAKCCRLDHLALHGCNTAGMQSIGETCKAPLRFVEVSDRMSAGAIRGIASVLAGVVVLDTGCQPRS